MRADARRNYERLLACAHEAFTERGADASLEDIARRAGVGIGTLYRHFPTREALLVALLSDRLHGLVVYAEEVLERQEPDEAVANWIRASWGHGRIYHGLAVSVMAKALEFDEACAAAQAAGARLLARARQAGRVRPDITRAHLTALVHGLVVATENEPEMFEQLLAVVLAGLSAR